MSKPFSGGLFSAPITNATMDPYIDKNKVSGRPHGQSKGMPQFGISVKGIPGKFNRLYEGETFVGAAKQSAQERMKGREKFLTPSGFRHSSPIKKSSSKGDFFGTFRQKPPSYIPDGTYGERGSRVAIRESAPKNFYTNPPRKAAGEALGTTPKTCFSELEYVPSHYDSFQETVRVSSEKLKKLQLYWMSNISVSLPITIYTPVHFRKLKRRKEKNSETGLRLKSGVKMLWRSKLHL